MGICVCFENMPISSSLSSVWPYFNMIYSNGEHLGEWFRLVLKKGQLVENIVMQFRFIYSRQTTKILKYPIMWVGVIAITKMHCANLKKNSSCGSGVLFTDMGLLSISYVHRVCEKSWAPLSPILSVFCFLSNLDKNQELHSQIQLLQSNRLYSQIQNLV